MSSAVGFNPQSLSPKEIQELQKQQGQSGTNVGFNVGEQTFSDFEQMNNKLSTNDGFTYKNSAATTTGSINNAGPDVDLDAKLNEANSNVDKGNDLLGGVTNLQGEIDSSHADLISNFAAESEVIDSSTNQINSSQSKIEQLKESIANSGANIDTANMTIAEMQTQIAELNEQGLAMLAEAGIEGEWGSVEEAMAELGELIDPDKLAEIATKEQEKLDNQTEIDSKTKEMEGLPDDDPKKAELQKDIDGLNADNAALDTEIAELNVVEGQSATMTQISDALATLGEVSAQIGVLNEGIAQQQTIVDTEVQNLETSQTETNSEAQSVKSSNSKISTAKDNAGEVLKGGEEDNSKKMKVANGFAIGGGVVTAAGGVMVALAKIPPLVALEVPGQIGIALGGSISTGASIAQTQLNDNLSDEQKTQQTIDEVGKGAENLANNTVNTVNADIERQKAKGAGGETKP